MDPTTLALLLMGGGSITSAILGADAQNDANAINQSNSQADRDMRMQLLTSGSIDPYGNLIDKKDGSGPYKTILAPGPQKLADTGLKNAVAAEESRGTAGGIRDTLYNRFKTGAGEVRAPLDLAGARGVVEKDDNAIKNAILNPALSDASIQDQRTFGNSSNKGLITSRFQERILPQIKLGGEQKAMSLADSDRARFTNETVGLGEGLNKIATGGYQPTIPGVANLNAVSQASNAIPKPIETKADNLGSAFASGAAGIGSMLYANEQNNKNDALNQQLLSRLRSNQG